MAVKMLLLAWGCLCITERSLTRPFTATEQAGVPSFGSPRQFFGLTATGPDENELAGLPVSMRSGCFTPTSRSPALRGLQGRRDALGGPPTRHCLNSRYDPLRSPALAGITGAVREWTVAMISELSIPWR